MNGENYQKLYRQFLKYRSLIAVILLIFVITIPVVSILAAQNKEYVCSEVEDSIYATLIEQGYTPAGACGILGNISVEDPKFEPDLVSNGGNTYGLFQWTDNGNRKSFLTRWCNNRLLYPNRVDGQLAYALYELEGGDSIAKRVNEFLKTTDDPEEAAMEFAVGFERCIGSTGNKELDGIYDGKIYPEYYGATYQALSKRIANAASYYEKYTGQAVDDDLAIEIEIVPTAGIVAENEDKVEELIMEVVPTVDITIEEVLWTDKFICLGIGYLFGCILGAPIITARLKKKEKYKMGNKLPSIRNILSYVGFKEALFAILVDVAKFYLALYAGYLATGGALRSQQILWVGLGVVLGNDFPFWRKFKGGMGIVVSTLMICTYMPIWGVHCCFIGLLIAVIAKSLPFGAIFVSIAAVPYAFICKSLTGGIFTTIVMLLVLIRHYKFIVKFIDRELIRKHYRRNRRRQTAAESAM